MKGNCTRNGFTFVEILVVVGVVSIISVVIAQSFFVTTRSNVKTEVIKDVKQSGLFATTIMEQMIRNAQSVDETCAEEGTELRELTITNADGQTTTFGCHEDIGVMRIASSSSGTRHYLTSSAVTLGGIDCSSSTLRFVCRSSSYRPTSVTISFRLTQAGVSPDLFEQADTEFQTSVSLRRWEY